MPGISWPAKRSSLLLCATGYFRIWPDSSAIGVLRARMLSNVELPDRPARSSLSAVEGNPLAQPPAPMIEGAFYAEATGALVEQRDEGKACSAQSRDVL
jgi:hypothetical protein